MHDTGQILAFFILVTVTGLILARAVGTASATARGNGARRRGQPPAAFGLQAPPGSSRARKAAAAVLTPSPRHIRAARRAKVTELWESARAADWLETRRHQRQLAAAAPPAPARAPAVTAAPPGSGRMPGPPPGPHRPPAPTASHGGTAVMAAAGTSTASAEKLIEGVNEIHAHAATGNIHRKREAIAAGHEGAVRFASMLAMLARMMAEPGSNYGPEITEPLAKAAQHCQAAAITISESDAALTSLLNMRVADLADSPRQAPHHSELTESGAH